MMVDQYLKMQLRSQRLLLRTREGNLSVQMWRGYYLSERTGYLRKLPRVEARTVVEVGVHD